MCDDYDNIYIYICICIYIYMYIYICVCVYIYNKSTADRMNTLTSVQRIFSRVSARV
jgi:hypothetical protein